MKNIIWIFIFLILITYPLSAVNITNYAEGRSSYASVGIYFMNKPPIEFVEDYYRLYSRRLYWQEGNIQWNIKFMKGALNSPFQEPYKALCPVHTKIEHAKYKALLKMRLYVLIVKSFLQLGRMYDMIKLYYFHDDFREQIIESYGIADYYYKCAEYYWPYAKKYANIASKYKKRLPLEDFEDERYLIIIKEVDWQYGRIIKQHRERLANNLSKIKSSVSR